MSPDEVDQAILAFCKPQFLKVARVIMDVPAAFKVPLPMERIFIDVPKARERPMGTDVDSAGNLNGWRSSEIRLSKKTEQGT
jgi:hypothetical protein